MERYAFRPVSTPTAPRATLPDSTSTTVITPGTGAPHSHQATSRTRSPVTSFATPMTEKILQRIPIAMTLGDLDAEENIDQNMETEVTDNRTPQPLNNQNTRSKLKTPLSKPTSFVWEHHLNNEFFSQWLLKYIIPHRYKAQVKEVFKAFDNIMDYEQLQL